MNDPEYLDALSKATPAEMVAASGSVDHRAWRSRARQLRQAEPRKFRDTNAPNAAAASTGTVSRTVKIYGVDQTFSRLHPIGGREANRSRPPSRLSRQFRARDAASGPTTGQFISKPELNPAEMYELEMKMKRGEITVQQFLAQSGELARAFDDASPKSSWA